MRRRGSTRQKRWSVSVNRSSRCQFEVPAAGAVTVLTGDDCPGQRAPPALGHLFEGWAHTGFGRSPPVHGAVGHAASVRATSPRAEITTSYTPQYVSPCP